MQNLNQIQNQKLENWINSIPFVMNADIEVYIDENNNTGIRARDKEKGAKHDEKLFNKIRDMIQGARWFIEFLGKEVKDTKIP